MAKAQAPIDASISFFTLEPRIDFLPALLPPSTARRVTPPTPADKMSSPQSKKTPKTLPYQPRPPMSNAPSSGSAPAPSSQRAGRPAPTLPASLRAPRPRPVDPSSPAYKAASRKYVSTMIAMPILLVTSWVLFDRLARGAEVKTFKNHTPPPSGEPLAARSDGGSV
ncbi:uncharacterized protein PG998_010554 [Apiospora kogelbergensis]|uniref:uncharacterized protein n=1 Tax=Apiospora kogelbergensis TaxID=1337665 RepID=UPI00312D38B6